jgi:multidrug efflux pump subunit AcrA (membrane-fusion protein)
METKEVPDMMTRSRARAATAAPTAGVARLLPLALAASLFIAMATAAMAQDFRVATRELPDLKAVFATVESLHVTPARARIGGTIGDLAIQEGSRIEVGQRLAVVGDPKLPLQLAALDAEIESLRAQQRFDELDLARMEKLRTRATCWRRPTDGC